MHKLFYGIAKDGVFIFQDKKDFDSLIQKYDRRELVLLVRPAEVIRTTAENRYYWGVIVKIVANEMGLIPDEAHEFLKSLFLKRGVEVNGKRWEVTKSTASLSVQEFEDYCEKCREWSSVELNATIPLPNEVEVEL